ncbi:hypothetical protein (nucleomorph) [Guillardia theta]|uniref:Uncharacterized protein n=1 Tax=Guillardia theta TaxID=55529 RepID=Q98RR1_GUITH|nr:hypothetical protein GTHECHR1093 [Guillardia theta]AAK39886.1 hypothetical protein [Guillardia theta]
MINIFLHLLVSFLLRFLNKINKNELIKKNNFIRTKIFHGYIFGYLSSMPYRIIPLIEFIKKFLKKNKFFKHINCLKIEMIIQSLLDFIPINTFEISKINSSYNGKMIVHKGILFDTSLILLRKSQKNFNYEKFNLFNKIKFNETEIKNNYIKNYYYKEGKVLLIHENNIANDKTFKNIIKVFFKGEGVNSCKEGDTIEFIGIHLYQYDMYREKINIIKDVLNIILLRIFKEKRILKQIMYKKNLKHQNFIENLFDQSFKLDLKTRKKKFEQILDIAFKKNFKEKFAEFILIFGSVYYKNFNKKSISIIINRNFNHMNFDLQQNIIFFHDNFINLYTDKKNFNADRITSLLQVSEKKKFNVTLKNHLSSFLMCIRFKSINFSNLEQFIDKIINLKLFEFSSINSNFKINFPNNILIFIRSKPIESITNTKNSTTIEEKFKKKFFDKINFILFSIDFEKLHLNESTLLKKYEMNENSQKKLKYLNKKFFFNFHIVDFKFYVNFNKNFFLSRLDANTEKLIVKIYKSTQLFLKNEYRINFIEKIHLYSTIISNLFYKRKHSFFDCLLAMLLVFKFNIFLKIKYNSIFLKKLLHMLLNYSKNIVYEHNIFSNNKVNGILTTVSGNTNFIRLIENEFLQCK